MRFGVTAGLAATLSVAVAVGPARAIVVGNGTDADYIALGNSLAYSSVGQIFGTTATGNFAASGVLIASDWMLTAAHVTDDATSLKFFTDAGGTNFSRAGAITADAWYTNPGWTGNVDDGFDIGLVHLSAAAPCLAAATCQTATVYTGTGDLGRLATLVGYGTTGTGAAGATTFDGLKRAGQNRADAVDGVAGAPDSIILADFDSGLAADNFIGSRFQTTLEAMIAPGDSGGGLFEVIGGVEYLVGVTSFIGSVDGNSNSDYGDIGGWTRVSSFVDWINSTIAANSAQADIPEPASLTLFGFGLVGIAIRRRR